MNGENRNYPKITHLVIVKLNNDKIKTQLFYHLFNAIRFFVLHFLTFIERYVGINI